MSLLETSICGIQLRNPTVLAAGILGVSKTYFGELIDNGIGMITIKSISRLEQTGHASPCVLPYEAGLINAVGYPNPGLEAALEEFGDLQGIEVPVVANIIGKNADDFDYMSKNFLPYDFSAVEMVLSCPHTPGYGMLAGQHTPEATYESVSVVRKNTSLPLIVKLTPNVGDITLLAKAAQDAGADAISACNSVGPGMVINIDSKEPVLDFTIGGLSGPAIKPIAIKSVYEIYEQVDIPIIGIGGITTGRDAIEMMMAGASAVGIGSAVYYRGVSVFKKINDEMEEWLKANHYSSVQEIVGIAHAKR
jgi:dihydroorotate dehydrogenase (NAD+) catalytic subunit